ncbi:hypothetical protein [Caballeronia arationis]|jgi:hypothetical protein|nr:hypothetical protein [Caballeronia arationis]
MMFTICCGNLPPLTAVIADEFRTPPNRGERGAISALEPFEPSS